MSATTWWMRPLRDGHVEMFARAQDGATIDAAGSFAAVIGLMRHFEAQHGTMGLRPAVRAQHGRRDETWTRNMAWLHETIAEHWWPA